MIVGHVVWVTEVTHLRNFVGEDPGALDARREDTRMARIVEVVDETQGLYKIEYLMDNGRPSGLTRDLDLRKHQIHRDW
jgi:hypothetical protein